MSDDWDWDADDDDDGPGPRPEPPAPGNPYSIGEYAAWPDDEPVAADEPEDDGGFVDDDEMVGGLLSGYDGDGPPELAGSTSGRDDGVPARTSNRGTRLLVLLVLVGMLVAGVALERREPEVTDPRVTTRGLDGPDVPPDDVLSTAWYCAAGTADPGGVADEVVVVGNLSPNRITADVTVDPGGDGEAQAARLRIEPYGRSTLPVSDVVTAERPGVVVEVAGGAAIVEHEIRGNGDVAMSPCAHEPSDTWYFAAGSTARGAAETLELFNPFGDDAIVDIAFLTEGGVQEPQALQGFVVGRRSKVQVPVGDLVARQERVATAVRTRTGRVVAEQVRSFDGTDGQTGLALSLGVAAPRREWTLPVAEARPGATGAVAIANFGLTSTSVEVSILLSGDGVLAPESVEVPSRSVVRFDPSLRIPAGTAYAMVVRAQGDAPVVVESLLNTPVGAATASGASVTARRWALAGAPDDASSAVIATNRGTVPLTVELRAYVEGDVDGPTSAPAIAVEPGKTVRFDLDEWGIDPDQVLVVSADGPIVVGRETYAGGESLALAVPFRD